MKKLFALLPALCLIFALAACGGKSVVGVWQSKMNFAEVAGDELGEMKDYWEQADLDCVLELKADSTFTMTMDGTEVLRSLRDAYRAYLSDWLKELDMTIEDYESRYGESVDAMIDEAIAEMEADMILTVSGSYTEKDGSLVLTPQDGTAPLEGTWKGDAMTLHSQALGDIVFARR